MVRNPTWTRDEVILACDLVAKNGWRSLDARRSEVIALSTLLRSLSVHPVSARLETFRNPNGVARKTADIATLHPDYLGTATRGGSHDAEVLEAFLTDPQGMAQFADTLRRAAESAGAVALADLDLGQSVDEGGVLERRHLARERDPRLRGRKIVSVLSRGGSIACEVCGFDYGDVYGERGQGYIEVHHRVPLHVSGATQTALDDLVLLCSNCHRMVHRRRPWLAAEQLKSLMQRD